MMPTTMVYLVSPDETQYWPVHDWDALTVTQERFGGQFAELTVRLDSQVGALVMAPAGSEYYGYALWVYHAAGLRKLFEGPALNVTCAGGPDNGNAYITVEFEGHLNAALRRRLCFSEDASNIGYGTTAPNAIALGLIDQAMGGITGPIYPTGYPGGGTGPLRTDYRQQTYAAGVAVGAPAAVTYDVQAGKNLRGEVEDLCQRYDMCPTMRRTAVATRTIDVEYPYESNDRTGTIVLTRRRGTSVGHEYYVPYTLTTVGRSAGSGSGSTQTAVWQTNNTATYGVYEDQLTTPEGTSAACTEDVKTIIRPSTPLITHTVRVRDTTDVRFGVDYYWRDGVLIYDPDYLQTTDATIIGYTYEATNGGRSWSLELEIGERRLSMYRFMAGRTGVPFGDLSGGRWKDTRG